MAAEVEAPAFPALFHSVTADLKGSHQSWEAVIKSAGKLSAQLLNTATSLNGFIEQIQAIGDSANNIKGASRDIGASLTRFCMRQRSIENHIRSMAAALTNQFCDNMEKKADEWKKRTGDIERRRGKCFKKSKQKKFYSQSDVLAEQREGCLELLFEQRNQFAFFVNAILPILDIEVNLLEEGEHVRQVRDSMEQIVNGTDPQAVVFSTMDDFCLNSERQIVSPAQSIISSATSGGLDRNASPSVDSFYSVSRNSTVSVGTGPFGGQNHRPSVPINSVFQCSSNSSAGSGRPPLPRGSGYNEDQLNRGSSQHDVLYSSSPHSASALDVSQCNRRPRPQSFSGGDLDAYNDATLKSTPGERSSALLIAETLQQIDQLGMELDSYCMSLSSGPPEGSSGVGSSVVSSIDQNGSCHRLDSPSAANTPVVTPPTYRHLPPSCAKNRPPPPERRNSTIQSATNAAPSIAAVRTFKGGEYASVQFREPLANKLALSHGPRPSAPPFPNR